MYALGLAFTGYAAAEAVGGSGFLAAFAAGLMVGAQDVELCDCFLEYGEATAEMLLLLTFVALGTSLIWSGLTVIEPRTLLFAAVALFGRTIVMYPMLVGVVDSTRERRLIALFGRAGSARCSSLSCRSSSVCRERSGCSPSRVSSCCYRWCCTAAGSGFFSAHGRTRRGRHPACLAMLFA